MEKPFSVKLRETRDSILQTLNNSGLPIDVMDMLLGEIRTVVHAQAEQEYIQQRAELTKQEEHDGESE